MRSRNNKGRSVIVLFLVVILLSSSTVIAYAEDMSVISIEDCQRLSEYWLELNYNDGTIIDEVIPIYKGRSICSYCVSFIKDTRPNGYIVIDSDRNAVNSILEFCLSGSGLFDILSNSCPEEVFESKSGKMLYYTGICEYAIQVDLYGSRFYNCTGEFLSSSELNSVSRTVNCGKAALVSNGISVITRDPVNYYNGFFNGGSLPSSGPFSYKIIDKLTQFTPYLMSELVIPGGYEGNCTPTAATNILAYYKIAKSLSNLGSANAIYSGIVAAGGWNQFGQKGMSFSAALKGMKSVVKSVGYSFSSSTYWFNLWSDWVRDISNDHPVLTSISGYKYDKFGNLIAVSHAVVAVGYREYDSGARYLRVCDGWHKTTNRFILFGSEYFTSISGICIKVYE